MVGGLVLMPGVVRAPREVLAFSSPRRILLVVGLVAVVLAVLPVGHRVGDAGYLWQVSARFPDLLGSSLLFWLLVPLGVVLADFLGRRALHKWPRGSARSSDWRLTLVLLAVGILFAASTVVTQLAYEKYFDPFVLLALLVLLQDDDFRSWKDFCGAGFLSVLSVGYALSFVV